MGITRASRHKRRHTGAKRKIHQKKRKFEMGRQPANTKIGSRKVNLVRGRGGNYKHRALRVDTGNFSWGSEVCTRKSRILDVTYNATNNELLRTKTLVKGCIVQIDATPFKTWFESHYGQKIGLRREALKAAKKDDKEKAEDNKPPTAEQKKRQQDLKNTGGVDSVLDDIFSSARLYAKISSRPGQSGRADGYILEGKELDFYLKQMSKKK